MCLCRSLWWFPAVKNGCVLPSKCVITPVFPMGKLNIQGPWVESELAKPGDENPDLLTLHPTV